MSIDKTPVVNPVQVTDLLVAELRRALQRHGIILPSLRADQPVAGAPLIELGRCNQETAERLVAVLDDAAAAGDAPAAALS